MSRNARKLISLIGILLSYPLQAQDPKDPATPDTIEVTQDTLAAITGTRLSFLDPDANRIHNSVSLSDFYEKLYRLRQKQNLRVNIIHIGDSHIQADFLSRVVRQNFQGDFGNGGRGLMIPGRVARTNQPSNLYSYTSTVWEVKRCVNPEKYLPIGIGGITLRTIQPNANFTIRTLNVPSLDYRFDKITLFFQKDLTSFNIGVQDSIRQDVAFIGPYTFEPFANTSTVQLPYLSHQVTFQMLPSTAAQTQAVIFGINLENGKPGVVYHAIGVNGAKFKHFVAATLFADQTAALTPDLIIVSLGTNEALDYPYSDPQLTTQIDLLLGRLKAKNPNTRVLLTTPSDNFRRRMRRNPGVEIVRNKIIQYADSHNLAYWDLYAVGGGKHAADHWRKNALMQRDGVHFTVKGYELQGNLLYEALMQGFEEYVQYRHH